MVTRYFHDHVLAEAMGLKAAATSGASLFYALDAEGLAG